MSTTSRPRIGVDVGGVILIRDGKYETVKSKWQGNKDKEKKKKKENKEKYSHREGIVVPDALQALNTLSQEFDLYIVSYCKEPREISSRVNLRRFGIDQVIPEERWKFVRKRVEKARICQEEKLDALVDDRRDILDHLAREVPNVQRFWFNGKKEDNHLGPNKHVIVEGWPNMLKLKHLLK